MTEKNQKQGTTQETGVATTDGGNKTVAVVSNPGQFVTQMLDSIKEEFLAVNAGLDMDFVRMAQMVKLNKLGKFVLARDEEGPDFGDTLDIVIAQGEQRWSLWGLEESPEAGQLIVAEKTQEEAAAKLGAWLMENPERTERYSVSDIQLRYMAVFVRVDTLAEAFKNEESPEIYMLPIATTDTYEYGGYAMELFKGKYKPIGIPSKTAVSAVVTRISSKEKKRGNNKWVGLIFQPVGIFNPADYGIVYEEQK